jgi:hypothetical protein
MGEWEKSRTADCEPLHVTIRPFDRMVPARRGELGGNMRRSVVTALVVVMLTVAQLAGGSAMAQVVAQNDDEASDGSPALVTLADGEIVETLGSPVRFVLERLHVGEAPDGSVLLETLGPELLYVEAGRVTIGDQFGIEGLYDTDKALMFQPPTAYSLRTEGPEPATILRLAITPDGADDMRTSAASNLQSEVLIDETLDEIPEGSAIMRLLRAEWSPGTDIGKRTFAGPVALLVEDGVLSLLSPSGLTGQLDPGDAYLIPNAMTLGLSNAGSTASNVLVAQLLPVDAPVLGSEETVLASDGTVLDCGASTSFYHATLGDFHDWDLTAPWVTTGELLKADGSASGIAVPPIEPIGCDDYSIQAVVQRTSHEPDAGGGLAARVEPGGGIRGGFDGAGDNGIWVGAWGSAPREAEPGNQIANGAWEVVRLDVDGERIIFARGQDVIETSDSSYLNGGIAGVWSDAGDELYVRCFEIIGTAAAGQCSTVDGQL